MDIIIGIDAGGSAVKLAAYRNGYGFIEGSFQTVKLGDLDMIARNYISSIGLSPSLSSCDLEIVLTGTSSAKFNSSLCGLSPRRADEIFAIARGGLYLSGLSRALVVSMGTGTAFVRADEKNVKHLGGSGVGGSSLLGLSRLIIGEKSKDELFSLIQDGRLENVDLTIGEIAEDTMPTLPPYVTAANFGSIKPNATEADILLGLENMVLQTIGVMADFALKNDTINDVVLIGALPKLPRMDEGLLRMGKLCGRKFIIPKNSEYATVIGAIACFLESQNKLLDHTITEIKLNLLKKSEPLSL